MATSVSEGKGANWTVRRGGVGEGATTLRDVSSLPGMGDTATLRDASGVAESAVVGASGADVGLDCWWL